MITKTNQRLWIFGDSFANVRNGEKSWQILLKNRFVGNDIICSARGGRDIQTIIDIFLQSLHLINDDDFVIMILPTTARVRYAVSNPRCLMDMGNELNNLELTKSLMDGFTAYHAHNPHHKNIKNELLYPFNKIDDKFIEDFDEHNYAREILFENAELNRILSKQSKFSYNQTSVLINTSDAMLESWNTQFYSFSKAFKFEMMFYSWSNDFEIFDKSVVISDNQIGKLQTQHELYIESDNQFGEYGDHHWSDDGNIKFSEYIINNNPKYFN